jgi:cyclohexanone monooxygenase
MSSPSSDEPELDVAIVGAGFAGLYAIHRFRRLGLTVRAFEKGDGVGGTWYWNRYPGARCDVESIFYSYNFSEDLHREWEWTERYPSQPEILAYLNHVADRFDLRSDIELETLVTSVEFDDTSELWTVNTDRGSHVARFVVMATGCLSTAYNPNFPGQDTFRGEIYSTSSWPHDGVDFHDKKVAVIGTGSSGIQSTPQIAKDAEHLYVLQRTPQYSIPAWNAPIPPETRAFAKEGHATLQRLVNESHVGIPFRPREVAAKDEEPETLRKNLEDSWATGGYTMALAYPDLILDEESNQLVAEFVAEKIREKVHDPEVAEKLIPKTYPFAAKRLCVDTGYFEMYNRDNVTLVDVNASPIDRITETGIVLSNAEAIEVDAIVFATGFDAMTGSLLRANISGRHGRQLADAWAEGPTTYLGLMIPEFPNLFTVTGPGSPSVLSNMVPSIEFHIDWIAETISALRSAGARSIEANPDAAREWTTHVDEISQGTLYPRAGSWYMGANIPGKKKGFIPYAGGTVAYREIVAAKVAENYSGFDIDADPDRPLPGPAPRRSEWTVAV